MPDANNYTAFAGDRLVASGPITEVAVRTKDWLEAGGPSVLIFDDQTGRQTDLDLRGTHEEALARLQDHPLFRPEPEEKRSGPGRPKLGVVCREVSLLPRHWDWLNTQSGGASVTLRKLVEEKMKNGQGAARARQAHDAASRFMWTMAGNMPDFEEASRAFSRREYARFETLITGWPEDIQAHVRKLAAIAQQTEKESSQAT